MDFEIFDNEKIVKGKASISFDYPSFLDLCERIKKENNSVLDHILEELCILSNSSFAELWTTDRILIRRYQITSGENFPCENHVKNFLRKIGNFAVISNDILSDARFKIRKKVRRNTSMPATAAKRKKSMLFPPPKCSIMIIPHSMGYLIVSSASDRIFKLEDLEKVLSFMPLIENVLSRENADDSLERVEKTKGTDDVKDIFLATVSHELRTPLNGIVGMVTMLKDAGPLNEKQHEYLTILMECSHQLMTMMNNILDFSKMVSNRLVLLRGPMKISKVINDASLMVEGKIKSKSLKFEKSIQHNIPTLIGDGQRLTQILSNLLSNAAKFTEHGHISLKVTSSQYREKEDSLPYVKKWKVLFEVEDTGIGIPKGEQSKIFEMFHQSSNLDTIMAKNGTGLGLSISRELVKMMGGKIDVFSEGIPGRGSIFRFYIITEEEIQMRDLQKDHKDIIIGSSILVVDDRPEYRMQIADMLFKWGCKPITVSSGEEALQHISHGTNFDTIIVDICMPYMNGIELAQELKGDKKTLDIPLIALSSVDLQGGTELFDVYMNKPIDQNYLFPAILECLIRKKEGKSSSVPKKLTRGNSGRTRKSRKHLKILIAEDDLNNSYTIKEMLKYLGFNQENIKTVENGEKCVSEAKKECYDVILMDILMPIMNGLEATKHIRQLKPRPYIIAVSAAVQNSDKQRCQQVGVDSYLSKPLLKEKLNAALIPLVSD